MTPAIAALTLSLCGHDGFSERLGANTAMRLAWQCGGGGAARGGGLDVSEQAVFLVTARAGRSGAGGPVRCPDDRLRRRGGRTIRRCAIPQEREHPPWQIFAEPALHVFAICRRAVPVANAALLPVALNGLTAPGRCAGLLVSATIIVPQIIAAVFAPWAGKLAQRIGRRPVLLAGFAAVPVRALFFAVAAGRAAADGVAGARWRQRGGVRLDAAADRRRPDDAHRLPQSGDRRAGACRRPGRHVQHRDRRLDRRSVRRCRRRFCFWAVSVPRRCCCFGWRCRKHVPPEPQPKHAPDAEKATQPV